MAEDLRCDRRRFLGTAAMTMAAARLGLIGAADAQPRATTPAAVPTITPGTHTSFGALQQIEAGVLHVGYAEAGPADGLAVMLLHGWPYDISSDVDVAPVLASAGYRVIVPYLRGYGTTRFRSPATPRNGQQSVLAVDVIALMEALHIAQASRHTTHWNSGWPKGRSSPCPPSPWKGMPMGRRTRTPVRMPSNSRAPMRTG